MARVPPLVLLAEPIEPAPLAWLGERCRVVEAGTGGPDFEAHLARARGLIVRTYSVVDEPLLRRAPLLEVVARAGTGLDNVDVPACRRRGVQVVYTPEANTRAVAEYVFGAILHIVRAPGCVRGENLPHDVAGWQSLRDASAVPRQLSDLTLGIVGLGRIGGRVARIARAFDVRAVYCDVVEIPAEARPGAEPVSLEALLGGSDVVTIHVDGRESNRGLIGEDQIGMLREDAILINTSRGFVVDARALASWLRAHGEARAVLDVHDPEPIEGCSPLLDLPNALLTPHVAAATRTSRTAMSWVVRDVWRVLCGEVPVHPAP